MAKVVKVTKEKLEEMKQELDYLKTTRNDEIAEQIKIARGYGDLSENAEYDEAKNEQGKLWSRIAELEAEILNAVIIEENGSEDVVSFGSKIVIKFEDDEDEEEEDIGFGAMTSINTASAPATGFSGQVLNRSVGNKQEVVLFRPGSFNDTSKAADDLRNRKAVIVNMENVDKAMARRVVDFLSGCVYALDGDVKKIAQSAYLFCPHNMDIVGDLETLQAEVESYI